MTGRASPADHVRALVSGYASSKRGSHLMAIIQAYVDDSGNSPDGGKNPVFVLGGYISTADKWQSFSDAWEAECAKAPAIPDFKMVEANGLRGAFRGWTREATDDRCMAFARIIQAHAVVRIHTAIAWKDWHEIIQGKVPGMPENPYFWMFFDLMRQVADWQVRSGLQGSVDYIFDDQGLIGEMSAGWYSRVRAAMPPSLQSCFGSTPIFKHDKDVLPLKAADMWAWHVRRYLWKSIDALRRGETHQHPPLMRALMTAPPVGNFIDAEMLELMLEGYREGAEDARRGVTAPWEE